MRSRLSCRIRPPARRGTPRAPPPPNARAPAPAGRRRAATAPPARCASRRPPAARSSRAPRAALGLASRVISSGLPTHRSRAARIRPSTASRREQGGRAATEVDRRQASGRRPQGQLGVQRGRRSAGWRLPARRRSRSRSTRTPAGRTARERRGGGSPRTASSRPTWLVRRAAAAVCGRGRRAISSIGLRWVAAAGVLRRRRTGRQSPRSGRPWPAAPTR